MAHTNNPFAPPSSQNILNPFNPNAAEKYPSIEIPGKPGREAMLSGPPLQYQQPTGQYQTYNAQPMSYQQTGYSPNPSPALQASSSGFHPSTSFGQNLQAQVNQYSQVKDLDPYGGLPNAWAQQAPSRSAPSPQPPTPSPAHTYGAHPRQIVENVSPSYRADSFHSPLGA
jgi:hypothetical protein